MRPPGYEPGALPLRHDADVDLLWTFYVHYGVIVDETVNYLNIYRDTAK